MPKQLSWHAATALLAWSLFSLLTSIAPPAAGQERTSSPEAQALYNDAANFQNNGAVDLAVETWQKLLERHPEDPLSAKGRLYLGVCLMQLERYEPAIAAFRDALKQPNFDFAEETLLNLGLAQYSVGEKGKADHYAAAAATLGDLLRRFPESKHAAQALYFQGEALYRLGKKEESLQPFSTLAARHAQSKYAPDALYALGFAFEELSRFDEAVKTYDQFLAEHPKHDLALTIRMRKAETLMSQGEFAAAAEAFDALAQEKGFDQADRARYQQAYCEVKQKNFGKGADLYALLVETHPQSSFRDDSAIAAGRCYYQAERLEDAAAWLARLVEQGGKNAVEAAHWLCLTYIKQGQFRQAEELAQRIIPQAAESSFLVDLKMNHAEALAQQEDRKEDAFARFSDIAVGHANHVLAPKALYNAAFLAWEMRRLDEALRLSERFLESFPDDPLSPDAQFIGADVHFQGKRYEEAVRILSDLLASHEGHPDRALWQLQLAHSLFALQEHAEVVKLTRPLAESPGPVHADSALMLLARAQRELGQLEPARTALVRLIENYPNSRHLDHAAYRLGEYAYAANEHDKAIEHYNRVLTRHAESFYAPYALHSKGWALLKKDEFSDAAGVFSAFLDEHSTHELAPEARFARGMCLRQAGEHQKAVDDFAAYLKSPGQLKHRIEALYEQGLALTALKDHVGAAASFETIVLAAPNDPSADKAMYELAWSLKLQGEEDKAAEWFARLAKEHPQSDAAAEASFQVAERHFAQGEHAEAIKRYEESLERKPPRQIAEQASYKIGWSHYTLKDFESSLASFTRQATEFPDGPLASEARFMQAECLFKLGKHETALKAFSIARERGGLSEANEVVALLHGGQAAAQLGDWKGALEWFGTLLKKHPDSPFAAEALYEQGWARHNLQQYDEALKDYEQVAERTRSALGARARFMAGEVRFLRSEHEAAIRDFQRVMYGYGGAQAPEDVRPWQAKAGFEAGRCSEVLIQQASEPAVRARHAEEAKKFYSYVVSQHAQDELAKTAQQRLTELQKLAGR